MARVLDNVQVFFVYGVGWNRKGNGQKRGFNGAWRSASCLELVSIFHSGQSVFSTPLYCPFEMGFFLTRFEDTNEFSQGSSSFPFSIHASLVITVHFVDLQYHLLGTLQLRWYSIRRM